MWFYSDGFGNGRHGGGVVTEIILFIDDKGWIKRFGEILYMQYPDEHPDYPSDKENFYGWLMQFKDASEVL